MRAREVGRLEKGKGGMGGGDERNSTSFTKKKFTLPSEYTNAVSTCLCPESRKASNMQAERVVSTMLDDLRQLSHNRWSAFLLVSKECDRQPKQESSVFG